VFRRPSSRRKSGSHAIELNLVPMMDAFVTLIAFLLYTMAFVAFISIETPLPTSSPLEVAEALKEKPLQLTVSIRQDDVQIWSAFDKVPSKIIQNVEPGMPDFKLIHEHLITIKQQFPTENKVVIAPAGLINYEAIIGAMDSIRLLEPTDPAIFAKNTAGVDEQIKQLFPEVIFGNILGRD